MSALPSTRKRVALVTGGAVGLGASFAARLAREGYDIVLVDRQAEKVRAKAAELADRHQVNAHVIVQDLTVPGAAAAIRTECEGRGAVIDLLVNNAGLALNRPLRELPWENIRANIQLLLGVVVELTHQMLPGMVARGWGRVINVASLSGFMPGGVGLTIYGATKSFLIPFSESLDFELDQTGVRVTAVCPGFIRTDMFENSGLPGVRESVPSFMWLEPDRVADEAYRAAMAGVPLRVPGLLNRLILAGAKLAPRRVLRERSRILHRKAHRDIAEAVQANGVHVETRRVALITGASSGIGASFAEVLARNEHDVVLVARRRDRIEERAAELAKRYNVRAHAFVHDLTDPGAPAAILADCRKAGISVDVVVNSAGYPFTELLHEMSKEALQAALQIGVWSVAHITNLFLPGMLERGFGRIINVSSMAAFEPGSYRSALYSSSKLFVVALTESLAAELEGTGVTATAVCPGFTKTEWVTKNKLKNASFPSILWMESSAVAEAGYRDAVRGVPVSMIGTPALRALSTLFQIAPRNTVGRFLSNRRKSVAL